MKIHRTVQNNPQQRIQDVAEIISELRDPLISMIVEKEVEDGNEVFFDAVEEAIPAAASEIGTAPQCNQGISKAEKDRMLENQQKKKVEIAKIRVKLNVLKDDLETAVREKDFMRAQDLQMEIDELDENLQTGQEELALLVVPRSVERKVASKARVEMPPPPPPPLNGTTMLAPPATQTQSKETPEVILKCLVMLFELMQSSDINSLNATLQTIHDEFVKAAVSSMNVEIKTAALKTIGAFCLRSLDLAKRQLLLFSQIALVDLVNIRVTALEVIFDLLMWYGILAFNDQDSTLESMFESQEDALNLSSALALDVSQVGNPVVAKLSELLDDRDLEVRTKVAEGLCKLMMSKVITSSKLFTRLILVCAFVCVAGSSDFPCVFFLRH